MTVRSVRRILAAIAIILGAAAAFVGGPAGSRHAAGRTDGVAALAGQIEREEDHVTARELGTWIREKRAMQIFDLRTRSEFDESHLPGARHVSIETLVAMPFQASDTIVLYSEGRAHAAQAWVLLRAAGHERVYFLKGGLREWTDYFGTPRSGDPESGGC